MTDIPDELVKLQRISNEAHEHLRALQDRFGPPTQDGGWTEEQHHEWGAAWKAWYDAAIEIRSQANSDLEMAVKKAARGTEE